MRLVCLPFFQTPDDLSATLVVSFSIVIHSLIVNQITIKANSGTSSKFPSTLWIIYTLVDSIFTCRLGKRRSLQNSMTNLNLGYFLSQRILFRRIRSPHLCASHKKLKETCFVNNVVNHWLSISIKDPMFFFSSFNRCFEIEFPNVILTYTLSLLLEPSVSYL